MKTSSELSMELEHAHLVLTRDKHLMTVLTKDRVTIVAVLEEDHVAFALHADHEAPFTVFRMPMQAFDEILEMILHNGRGSSGVRFLPPTEKESLANETHT